MKLPRPLHNRRSRLRDATTPGDPAAWPANAGQFAARWNHRTPTERQQWLNAAVDAMQQRDRLDRVVDLAARWIHSDDPELAAAGRQALAVVLPGLRVTA